MRSGFRTLQLGRRHMSLTVETINPAVVGAQYAVRGELVLRAAEIKKQIAATPDSLPIKKVLECNIGNPQAVGQQPLSFGRQVQSLLAWPALMDMPGASETFAPDAIAEATPHGRHQPENQRRCRDDRGYLQLAELHLPSQRRENREHKGLPDAGSHQAENQYGELAAVEFHDVAALEGPP